MDYYTGNSDSMNFAGDFLLPSNADSTAVTSASGTNNGPNNPGHKMHLDPLISFEPMSGHAPFINPSPISSPGIMSPPSTANTVENRVFQFPPPQNATQPPIKNEDWSDVVGPCLQDTPTSTFPPGPIGMGSSQGSPMAISPVLSTLNTPRGSITSMRSHHSGNSPMNTDAPSTMGMSLAPPSPGVILPPPLPSSTADPMMTSNAEDVDLSAFVSYTTVTHQNFPSPPGSPLVTSTTQSHPPPPPPPDYNDFYVSTSEMISAPPPMFLKSEPGVPSPVIFPNVSSVMTNYGSTPDPSESFVSSDTCPETPDSSVKEEGDVNSPDTGSYICLWQDCHEEFVTQKALVEHIGDQHMNSQKGCEEFPCLWKVRKNQVSFLKI